MFLFCSESQGPVAGQFVESRLWLILTGVTAWRSASGRDEMKDKSRHHACPNGNDCASPPIRNNAKGENHQRGQQGNFDKGFHRQKHAPALPRFPALDCATLDLLIGPVATHKKAPGNCPGASLFRCLSNDQ
jgi:hypothetical protein